MTEQNLHDYNKWLMEVWNPNQLYIPFGIDAPKAFLDYQAKQLSIQCVNNQRELLIDLLTSLEKGGGNRFVSKEWIADNYLQGN
tara:strand:+ start:1569 stop:1820 length:252 start_codon:yes stop_codon:yes gene_type:complete